MSHQFFSEEDLQYLRQTTLEELEELYEKIQTLLDGKRTSGEPEKETLSNIGDMFHTIKGTAGLAGFEEISRLGAVAEDAVASGNGSPDHIVSVLQETSQQLGEMLDKMKDPESGVSHE